MKRRVGMGRGEAQKRYDEGQGWVDEGTCTVCKRWIN